MAAMVALPPNNMSRMPPTTNIDHHNTLYKPIGTRLRGNFTETKNVNIFTNGDVFHAPRKFVINKKKTPDWEHLLDVITDGLNPYFGAVRHLYTPNNGSEFVSTGDFVEKLHNNQTLVAGGREKFRHKGYLDFGKKPMKDKPPKLDRLPPKRLNVSSKLYNTEMCTVISVFRNNQPGDWAQVKVTPRMKKYGMGHILDEITDKFKWKFNYNTAVRKLFTTNGVRILETKDIVKSGAYVACGLEPFKPSDSYIPEINNAIRQNKKQQPNRIQTKPEPNKTYAAIHKDRTQQKTNNSPRTELHVINPRRQPGSYRPYPPTERETFPNKPVKHKRDTRPGAPSTEADDNARGPVFKARHGRVQAQEVPEDEDTKVDLPFDQVPAETVDTESILDVPADQTEPDVRKSSPMEAEVKTFSNVNSPTPSQGSRVFESKKSVPKEEAFGTSQSPVLTPTSPKNKSPILRAKSFRSKAVVEITDLPINILSRPNAMRKPQ